MEGKTAGKKKETTLTRPLNGSRDQTSRSEWCNERQLHAGAVWEEGGGGAGRGKKGQREEGKRSGEGGKGEGGRVKSLWVEDKSEGGREWERSALYIEGKKASAPSMAIKSKSSLEKRLAASVRFFSNRATSSLFPRTYIFSSFQPHRNFHLPSFPPSFRESTKPPVSPTAQERQWRTGDSVPRQGRSWLIHAPPPSLLSPPLALFPPDIAEVGGLRS